MAVSPIPCPDLVSRIGDSQSSELASPLAAFATPAESLMAADLILAAIRSIFSESAGLRSLAISKAKVVSQYVTYWTGLFLIRVVMMESCPDDIATKRTSLQPSW